MSTIYSNASLSVSSVDAEPPTTMLPVVERVRWRARRFVLWMRYLWSQGLLGTEQGLAISHAEIDRLLLDPDSLLEAERSFYQNDENAAALQASIDAADAALLRNENWTSIRHCFDLTDAESDLMSLAVAVEIEPGLRRVFAYLHDDVHMNGATCWLASRLFEWREAASIGPDSNLCSWLLASPADKAGNPWSSLAQWVADPAIVLLVNRSTYHDPALGQAVTISFSWERPVAFSVHAEVIDQMRGFVQTMRPTMASPVEIELIGPTSSGKRTLALQFAETMGRHLLAADASKLLAGVSSEIADERATRVLRMARVAGAIPYWYELDSVSAGTWRSSRRNSDVAIFGRTTSGPVTQNDLVIRQCLRLNPLDSLQRESLWKSLTTAPVPDVVHDRLLTAGQIALLARASVGGEEVVRQTSRSLVEPPNELVEALPCPYTWDDLVVSKDLREQLEEFEKQARLRWHVYEQWGFGRLCPMGKGITALFGGPSGTGKTMAVQVIARSLDLELYRVDLAGVVNKYIGETEKRLKQVFDRSERSGVLLFFDEADALFGQRTQVKDAHDRFANIEIDYLLQRMERYDGIAILATNRKNDLDTAFLRRIRFLIDFLLPGPDERLRIWQRALLPLSPVGERLLDDLNWNLLAEKLVMTGADIKNAALRAAFLAKSEGKRIGMEHVLMAARREMAKRGQMMNLKNA